MQGGAKSVTRNNIYGSVILRSVEDIEDSEDIPGSIGFFSIPYFAYMRKVRSTSSYSIHLQYLLNAAV